MGLASVALLLLAVAGASEARALRTAGDDAAAVVASIAEAAFPALPAARPAANARSLLGSDKQSGAVYASADAWSSRELPRPREVKVASRRDAGAVYGYAAVDAYAAGRMNAPILDSQAWGAAPQQRAPAYGAYGGGGGFGGGGGGGGSYNPYRG